MQPLTYVPFPSNPPPPSRIAQRRAQVLGPLLLAPYERTPARAGGRMQMQIVGRYAPAAKSVNHCPRARDEFHFSPSNSCPRQCLGVDPWEIDQ